MSDDKIDSDFAWFFRAIPVGILICFALFFWFRSPPTAPPSNARVFGCYTAPDGPFIRLDATGMRILQNGFPIIPFHLENQKTGIVLVADRPIHAAWNGSAYRFGIDREGIGTFLPFYRIEGDQIYGVFDPDLLGGFK